MATTDPAIYAIGDVAGGIMLAHKASKEARIAVETLAGEGGAVESFKNGAFFEFAKRQNLEVPV